MSEIVINANFDKKRDKNELFKMNSLFKTFVNCVIIQRFICNRVFPQSLNHESC